MWWQIFFFFFPSNGLQACLHPKPKPPCLGKDLISYLYIKISNFFILPNIMWLDLMILSFEDHDIISNITIFDIQKNYKWYPKSYSIKISTFFGYPPNMGFNILIGNFRIFENWKQWSAPLQLGLFFLFSFNFLTLKIWQIFGKEIAKLVKFKLEKQKKSKEAAIFLVKKRKKLSKQTSLANPWHLHH